MSTPVSKPVSKEQMETQMMEREDNASIQLGLSKFNVERKPKITENVEQSPPTFRQIPAEEEPIVQMSKPITEGIPMERQQEAITAQAEKMKEFKPKPSEDTILTSMYERYGPKIEAEAEKREEARQRRNRLARERYARKKASQSK
jgi:hypothetical protein